MFAAFLQPANIRVNLQFSQIFLKRACKPISHVFTAPQHFVNTGLNMLFGSIFLDSAFELVSSVFTGFVKPWINKDK